MFSLTQHTLDLQLEVNAKFCGSCKCIKYDAIEISLVWEKILGKVIVDIIVGKGCWIKDHWILINSTWKII